MEKLHELEICFQSLDPETQQTYIKSILTQSYLELSCNESSCKLSQGEKSSLLLSSFDSETSLILSLKLEGKTLASLQTKVQLLCEKRLSGDFSKRFKMIYKGINLYLNISGCIRILKEIVKNSKQDSKGLLKDFNEIVENRVQVDKIIDKLVLDYEKEFGLRLKNYDFGILRETNEEVLALNNNQEFIQEIEEEEEFIMVENKYLIDIALVLKKRLDELSDECRVVKEIEICLKDIDRVDGFYGFEDMNKISEGFKIRVEEILQENQEIEKSIEKSNELIKGIEIEIEEIKESCEVIRKLNEDNSSFSDIHLLQKEITDLSDQIAECEQESYKLSITLKSILSDSDPKINIEKENLINEKYNLLDYLHKKSCILDKISKEEADLRAQSLIFPPKSLPTGPSLETHKTKFNNLCTQSAKLIFDSALCIKSLEDSCYSLKCETEEVKSKIKDKDLESEQLSQKLANLKEANSSAQKLIAKDLKQVIDLSNDSLKNIVDNHENLLNELDFLSNLVLLQTVTWAKENQLHQTLQNRLEDL